MRRKLIKKFERLQQLEKEIVALGVTEKWTEDEAEAAEAYFERMTELELLFEKLVSQSMEVVVEQDEVEKSFTGKEDSSYKWPKLSPETWIPFWVQYRRI